MYKYYAVAMANRPGLPHILLKYRGLNCPVRHIVWSGWTWVAMSHFKLKYYTDPCFKHAYSIPRTCGDEAPINAGQYSSSWLLREEDILSQGPESRAQFPDKFRDPAKQPKAVLSRKVVARQTIHIPTTKKYRCLERLTVEPHISTIQEGCKNVWSCQK
jgi:hypothetical protein